MVPCLCALSKWATPWKSTFPSGSYGGSEGGGEEEKIFRHYEPFVNTLTGKHRTVQLGHL